MGPATITVMLLAALLIAVGFVVLVFRLRFTVKSSTKKNSAACPCGQANQPSAKFCARCGRALNGSKTESMKED